MKNSKREVIIFGLFAAVASLILTLTKIIAPAVQGTAVNFQEYEFHFKTPSNLIFFLIFMAVFYVAISLVYNLFRKKDLLVEPEQKKTKKVVAKKVKLSKKYFWVTFVACLAVFGIAFLVFYPGLGMNDTLECIRKPTASDLHPIVFKGVVYSVFHAVYVVTGNGNFSFAVIVVGQAIIAALIIARFITWLSTKNIRKWAVNLALVFFLVCPIITTYSIAVLKDVWFGYGFLLLLPSLYDFLHDEMPDKFTKIFLVLGSVLICISRTNGFLVILACAILVLVLVRKNKAKRMFALVAALILVIAHVALGQIKKVIIEKDTSFRESISIPLAQVAAVVDSGGEISEQNLQVLENILPIEEWKENYKFSFVDDIKYNSKFDEKYLVEHKKEFLTTWLDLMKNNKTIYVKTYLFQTYGLWNVDSRNVRIMDESQSVFTRLDNNIYPERNDAWNKDWAEYLNEIGLENRSLLPEKIEEFARSLYVNLIYKNMHLNGGVLLLILLFAMAMAFAAKKYKLVMTLLPLLLVWGTMMVATPASLMYRYNFYLLIALPFVIIVTLSTLFKHK